MHYQAQHIMIDAKQYTVNIPDGYKLELLTRSLIGPRLLTFLPNQELLIGSRSGHIYRLFPPYNKAETLLKLSDYPHSTVYRDNQLYIAQTSGLYKLPYTPGQSADISKLTLVAALPSGGHSSRTAKLGPDKNIYLSLGISGNCSDEFLSETYDFKYRRGGIFKLFETTKINKLIPYASGLRNPVGFDWHPLTGVMYASNNGPDHQGFDLPPEYFSKISQNSFHGMPWFQFNGKEIHRDDCINTKPPFTRRAVEPPVQTFPARNAPMDVAFVPKEALDSRFTNSAIVALRGSWGVPNNGTPAQRKAARRKPKLVAVQFSEGKAKRVIDFITGFQDTDGERWARPVGLAIGHDGNLYFTSDSGINGLFRLRRITTQ